MDCWFFWTNTTLTTDGFFMYPRVLTRLTGFGLKWDQGVIKKATLTSGGLNFNLVRLMIDLCIDVLLLASCSIQKAMLSPSILRSLVTILFLLSSRKSAGLPL